MRRKPLDGQASPPPGLQVLRLTKGTAGPRPRKLSE
nr:MAG TPA: hypothetical protein [Caudoviricetes sp.]